MSSSNHSSETSFLESQMVGCLSTFLKWLFKSYTTIYLAFIPTGVLASWARRTVETGGRLSETLVWMRRHVGTHDWFLWLTFTCILLWVMDLALSLLRERFVKKLELRKMRRKDEKIASLERENGGLRNNVSLLESELETKNIEFSAIQQGIGDMFHNYLSHLYEIVECQHTERLSLYVLREDKITVELVRRYPENNDQWTIRRTKHKITEGVIGKVQIKQSFYVSKLPDPDKSFSGYVKRQKKLFGYNGEEVNNFSMKARTYYAFRVSQKDDHAGFVVIESLKREFSDECLLNTCLHKHNDFLYHTLRAFRGNIPTYEQATKENF